jgi:hypothetical protein
MDGSSACIWKNICFNATSSDEFPGKFCHLCISLETLSTDINEVFLLQQLKWNMMFNLILLGSSFSHLPPTRMLMTNISWVANGNSIYLQKHETLLLLWKHKVWGIFSQETFISILLIHKSFASVGHFQ